LCIAVGGGASGALNMWYDADIDSHDEPHAKRPIPPARLNRATRALYFGLFLSIGSVVLLGLVANWLAARCWPSPSSSTPLSTRCG
jgi:protoheme IX farnesyltransferase